jgi:biotin transport system substrate-specific component
MKKLLQITETWIIALRHHKLLNNALVHTFCASWLIALGAHIKVPFYPVPMTMHTFAIALIALLTPWSTSVSAVILYLSYAAIGIPVLASGNGGISAFSGPTAGYLWGFILMSTAISLLTQWYKPQGAIIRFVFVLLGASLMFGSGLIHLTHLFGWEAALKGGLLPFVFSEPTKYALAAYLSVFIRDQFTK